MVWVKGHNSMFTVARVRAPSGDPVLLVTTQSITPVPTPFPLPTDLILSPACHPAVGTRETRTKSSLLFTMIAVLKIGAHVTAP